MKITDFMVLVVSVLLLQRALDGDSVGVVQGFHGKLPLLMTFPGRGTMLLLLIITTTITITNIMYSLLLLQFLLLLSLFLVHVQKGLTKYLSREWRNASS